MAKMVSMKRDAADRMNSEVSIVHEDEYGYGLRLHLDNAELEKLGFGTEMPEVGSKRTMRAIVEVVSTSKHEGADGIERSLSLQITDMGIDEDRPDLDAMAGRMYQNT